MFFVLFFIYNFHLLSCYCEVEIGGHFVVGEVGVVGSPFIVLPLTAEPTKPRLCHDARYLNLWMRDMPFSLDRLIDLPRYVSKDTYQTVLDDKSGYDHIILLKIAAPILGFNGAGGILLIIPFLLGGRFPHLFTILLVC